MTKHAAASFNFALLFISFSPSGSCLAQTPSYITLGINSTEKRLDKLIFKDHIVQKHVS